MRRRGLFRRDRGRSGDVDETAPAYLRDHAAHLRLNPFAVASTTLRFHLREGLTLLALMASHGRLGYEAMLAEMRAAVEADDLPDGTVDVLALATLARASVGWPGPGGDLTESADLFRALRLARRTTELRPTDLVRGRFERLEAQTNLAAGQVDHVEAIRPGLVDDGDLRWMVATELAHPERGLPGATWEGWLASFNRAFTDAGLAPLALTPGDGSPFDRLTVASPPAPGEGGPLVSVVMAAYRPDRSLFTAIRSVLDQTWPDLEVLLVDDCSPEEYVPILQEAAALDERVVLHRMPVNGGPYRIRNVALEQARGDFIAFQDSDDWSHPERVERQVRPLLDDPELVASFSRSVRLTSSLSLNKVGYAATRRNMSSLLFRRDVVRRQLGIFDEVRKSGDSEFAERLRSAFGDERICWIEQPMAVIQLTEDSLSRQDFVLGWRDPDRVFYRQEFEHWHALIRSGAESPRLGPGTRAFPAPASHLGLPTPVLQPAVTVVSDWRPDLPAYAGVVDEVEALVDAGVPTAILHTEAMRHASRARSQPDDRIMRLRRDGRLHESSWEGPLETDLVLVRDPELLAYPRRPEAEGLRARRVVIHAVAPPRAPDGGWLVYAPASVEAHAQALFGTAPEWLPATPDVAAALAGDGATGRVLPPAVLGAVETDEARTRPWSPRPVVGTSGLDKLLRDRLPAEELMRLLPQDDRLDVRVRDTAGVLDTRTAPQPVPAAWQRRDGEPLDDFLSSLDVYVAWSRRTISAGPSYDVLRALALGCVVVAPPALASHLGDAAVYVQDQSIEQVVLDLAADPSAVEMLRQRARDHLSTQRSAAVLVDRVRGLIDGQGPATVPENPASSPSHTGRQTP